ncbi:MAG: penicillin-binding transpeptidase domain-containing protein [Oscillospiraceae bacterium]|nr:penicillin-binding transpeptidase domain-containing protein [Oscillospiraceae bacterium]
MTKKTPFIRCFCLLAVFLLAVFFYGSTLLNMQIARADEYKRKTQATYTKKFAVQAVRGEIFDRNGIPLVTNKNIYDIVIDGTKMPKKGYVEILVDLVGKINFYNGELTQNSMPVMAIEADGENQETRYSYSMVTQNDRYRLDRFLSKNQLNVNTSADELVAYLTLKYSLDEYMPQNGRDPKLFWAILGICYEFDRMDVLAGSNTYKLCKDINKVLMAVIMENSHNYPGVEIMLRYERVYNLPNSAPHIIGTIGKISDDKMEWYTDRGYSMDAIVGKSGVEAAFEEYLRGIDGEIERTYDQDGNLLDERYAKEPIAGKDVYLTLDIELQQVAEHSLEKTIDRIHILSKTFGDPKLNGGDANSGGAAVIVPETGEVLAIATYPSYNITDTFNTEKYAELAADEKNRPLFNRATMGQYAPGSVFKIVTSVAALGSGYLGLNEYITDRGKYTAYEDYQPACWAYPAFTHGAINVTQAIEHSCNYFFFVVGDRMGINPLGEYAMRLGFGTRTGIEIGETPGILASREYAQSVGQVWTGGQTIAAAIGQSFNAFSPLQMATMLGAVLNGGQRYKNTLLLCVKEYGSDEIYYAPKPEIFDSAEISEAILNAVKQGMLNVIEAGTAYSLFRDFPRYFVGGKTGTAQGNIGKSSENGTFVAFAPYSNPEVVISSVIEKGSKGTWAGFVSEDVLAYYFGYKTFAEAMDLPEEPEDEEQNEPASPMPHEPEPAGYDYAPPPTEAPAPRQPLPPEPEATSPPPPPVTEAPTNPPEPETPAPAQSEETTETVVETPSEPESEAPPIHTEPEPEPEQITETPPPPPTEEPTIGQDDGEA